MVPDICFSLCGLLALVWKQRRAFLSPYVPLRHGCYPGGPSPCISCYRISFGYYAASAFHNVRWHFRVCNPGWCSDAETTLWISQVPKQETIGPLAACSTPGGLGDNAVWEGDPSRPPPYLLVQVYEPLPPVSSHDAHADFFRQHGSRAGR